MLHPKKYVPFLLFISFCLFLGYSVFIPSKNNPKSLVLKSVSLPNVFGGDLVNITSFEDFYLIHVFATWSPLCEMELETIKKIAQHKVSVVGIAYKENPRDVLNFITKKGNPYSRIGASTNGSIGVELGVSGPPETLVMKQNKVIYRFKGPVLESDIKQIILPLKNKGEKA